MTRECIHQALGLEPAQLRVPTQVEAAENLPRQVAHLQVVQIVLFVDQHEFRQVVVTLLNLFFESAQVFDPMHFCAGDSGDKLTKLFFVNRA